MTLDNSNELQDELTNRLTKNLDFLLKNPEEFIRKAISNEGEFFALIYQISNENPSSEKYLEIDEMVRSGVINVRHVVIPGNTDGHSGWGSYHVNNSELVQKVKEGGLLAFKNFYEDQRKFVSEFTLHLKDNPNYGKPIEDFF